MSHEKKVIYLIDDQHDEIERVRRFLGNRFIIAAGTSIDSAIADLKRHGRDQPDVYLLTMYYTEAAAGISNAEQGLNEARALFLQAEAQFYQTLAELRQTTEGGFKNLRDVRKLHYVRRVPIAFFTRKGTLDNAIRAYDEEGTLLIKKPDPSVSEAASVSAADLAERYDQAFEARKDYVVADIEHIIRRYSFRAR